MNQYLGERGGFIVEPDRTISPNTWENFFDNACWRDIVNTINLRLAMIRDDLEQLTGEEAAEARGGAKEIRFFLNLEDIIREEFKPKEEVDNG